MSSIVKLCMSHFEEIGKDIPIKYPTNYFDLEWDTCSIAGCNEKWLVGYSSIPVERLVLFGYTLKTPTKQNNETFYFVENIGNG